MTDTELEALAADSVGNELARAHDKISNFETTLKSSRHIGTAMRREPDAESQASRPGRGCDPRWDAGARHGHLG